MADAKMQAMSRHFFYGWVIVGVSFLGLFAAAATSPPVFTLFIEPIEKEFGWSRATIAGAISLGALATMPVLPLLGRFLDRHGARAVVTLSGLLTALSLVSLAWVKNIWGFYLLFGLGRILDQGVLALSCTVSVSNWFIRRRGRAQAIINVGRSLGTVLLPLVAYFILRQWDWRIAWIVIGIVIGVILVPPAAFLLRRRPEDVGLHPDGAAFSPADPSTGALSAEPQWTLSDAMRTRALWLVASAIFIRGLAAPGIAVHLIPYLLDRGVEPGAAAATNSLFSAGLGIGGLMWGWLAERRKVRGLFSMSFALSSAGVVLLLATDNTPLALSYGIIAGVALGGVFILDPVLWPEYYGRRSLGAIQGFTMPFFYAGTALGPILAGLVYDLKESYQIAFASFAVAYALAALMVFLAKPPQPRRGPR
ncbi:MAG: MFS transporter [Chloroflexi bacterium]|nr:MFS transporter [Chloroflexota bacterium]